MQSLEVVRLNIPGHQDGVEHLTDKQLSQRVKEGNEAAFATLVSRYQSFLQVKVSTYYVEGQDKDDLLQEATLGLLSAAESYEDGMGANFQTFAGVCIDRRLKTAYRSAARQKHIPLNNFISLNDGIDSAHVEDQLTSVDSENPETLFITREDFELVKRRIEQTLSGLEFKVLALYLSGRTYEEIAGELAVTSKAVDNALQRIRKKLRKTVS